MLVIRSTSFKRRAPCDIPCSVADGARSTSRKGLNTLVVVTFKRNATLLSIRDPLPKFSPRYAVESFRDSAHYCRWGYVLAVSNRNDVVRIIICDQYGTRENIEFPDFRTSLRVDPSNIRVVQPEVTLARPQLLYESYGDSTELSPCWRSEC